jgi:hypothetical protein
MSPAQRFADLTPSRQALVRLCQEINYGQILNLEIRDSDPILGSPPVVLFDVKLDADDGNRQEADLPDFALRDEVRRLMARLDELKDGRIERIEVRAGIPRRILIERRITESPSTACTGPGNSILHAAIGAVL